MNLQEIFDKSATHLLSQDSKSFMHGANSEFAYYGSGDKMDAIGCLIPLECYHVGLEGHSIEQLISSFNDEMVDIFGELSHKKINLLIDLQKIHDDTEVSKWKIALHDLTYKYNLSNKVLSYF